MFEKVKEIIWMIIFTLFFGAITFIFINEFMSENDMTNVKKTEVIIIEKIGNKGLFGPPSHHVRVKLPNGEVSDNTNRVSKRQLNHLEVGDTISGYAKHERNFTTIRDYIFDGIILIGVIFLFGSLTLLGAFMLITEIPAIDRFLEEKTFLGRRSNGKFGWKVFYVTMGVFFYIAFRFMKNLFFKLVPFKQTDKHAVIIDSHYNYSHHWRSDSYYEFTVQFETETGEVIHAMKEVTYDTFQRYQVGDLLPISYSQHHPYDLFVTEMTSVDFFDVIFYRKLFASVLITFVFIYSMYHYLRFYSPFLQKNKTDNR